MDIDKAKRDAQEQIDNALAEVARLKMEAKRIEDENETLRQKSEDKAAALQAHITTLEDDAAKSRRTLESLTQEINDKEVEKKSVSDQIEARREDMVEFNKLIEVKQDRLESLEKSGAKKVRKVDEQLEEKKAELRGLEKAINETVAQYESEQNRLRTVLTKLKKEVREEEEALTQKQEEVAVALDKVKKYNADAVAAEAARKEAEEAAAKAEVELKATTANIEQNATTLDSLKKQVEEVEAELKPLLAKRIESKNFIDELHAKEANLRKKYEDVGLEYK